MSIQVKFRGRLGNNLFQYALGRIITEQLEMELECIKGTVRPAAFRGTLLNSGADATLSELAEYFPNAPLHIPGKRFEQPIESFEVSVNPNWTGQRIEVEQILNNRTPRQIRLEGWFQRFEYYAPYRKVLRKWLTPRVLPTLTPQSKKDVLVNIRRGADFGISGWTLPLSYYEDALSCLPDVGTVYVCGTCIDQAVRDRLIKYKPVYYEDLPIQHFVFITRFNRIVLSNSTFAWWAAFLSDASDIFAPKACGIDAYAFTGFEDVDLHMRDNRYHEIPVRHRAQFAILRKNPTVKGRLNGSKHQAQFQRRDGTYRVMEVHEVDRSLVEWILKEEGPIILTEAASRFPASRLRGVVTQLLDYGVLEINPSYLDNEPRM